MVYPILPGNKKELFAIGYELIVGVRGTGDDGRGIAIGRPGEGQKSIKIPQIRDPLLLFLRLAETHRPGQTTIDGSDHKWNGPSPQEKSKRAG